MSKSNVGTSSGTLQNAQGISSKWIEHHLPKHSAEQEM